MSLIEECKVFFEAKLTTEQFLCKLRILIQYFENSVLVC